MTGSYQQTFGGNTIYQAQPSFRAVALTASVTLEWPTEDGTSGDVVANIMDVTATGGSWAFTMPVATSGSNGNVTLYYNAGATTYSVKDSTGTLLLTVATGEAWTLILTSNATAAGTWLTYQQGAGTSSATAASLAGFGLIAITTTLNTNNPVTTKSASYSFTSSDRAGLFIWTSGAGTFTLIAATGASNGWGLLVRNAGTGLLTIATQGADTINGAATITLNPADSCWIVSDGTSAFYSVGLGRSAVFAWDYVSISIAGSGTYTLSGNELNRVAYNFTGVLTGNRTVVTPTTIYEYVVFNNTTGTGALTLQPTGGTGVTVDQANAAILYCNGTDMLYAYTGVIPPGTASIDEAIAIALIFG